MKMSLILVENIVYIDVKVVLILKKLSLVYMLKHIYKTVVSIKCEILTYYIQICYCICKVNLIFKLNIR